MKEKITILFLSVLFFVSCGEYQKVLKSTDPEVKYDKAVEYYHQKKYDKAISLFDDISTYYRNTDRAEMIINYLANSYIARKDYYTASEYFQTYINAYPRGRFIEEARFKNAFCFYKDSPDVKLDQAATYRAIAAFQEFIDLFPNSTKASEADNFIRELNDKLAQKELLNAKLYYDLGTYMGNNYLSAVICAENALKVFPSTSHREDLMIVILKAKYQQAIYSDAALIVDRYQSTIDEAYTYMNEFPNGKYFSQAKDILAKMEKNMPDNQD